MELSSFSISELRALQKQIQQELRAREQKEVSDARKQIFAIAHSVGISLEELIRNPEGLKHLRDTRKVAVQYRHPSDNSLQWTGRGRKPKWVSEWIKSGRSLDEIKV